MAFVCIFDRVGKMFKHNRERECVAQIYPESLALTATVLHSPKYTKESGFKVHALRVQMALKLDKFSIQRHHLPSPPIVAIHVSPFLPSNNVQCFSRSFPSLAVTPRLRSTRSLQHHLTKFEDFGSGKSITKVSSEFGGKKRYPSKHFRSCSEFSSKRGCSFKFVHLDSEFGRKRKFLVRASTAIESATLPLLGSKTPQDINVLVVGSTGYIGKFVVKELLKRRYNVIAVARERSGIKGKNSKEETLRELKGGTVCFSDVTELSSLESSLNDLGTRVDVVVSCLASRSGGVEDSWKIDYEATSNSLIVGRKFGAVHFVLLSAICVQKPLLEFQRAKLKFEAELVKEAETGDFTYSIVRPTAFFKSLAGQVELVKDGKPYVMFGDGRLCACKPISEEDLASFIVDCILSKDKINKILPIGGPGKALTPLEQGEILFNLLGKEPKFLKVPLGIMDFVIGILDFLVKIFPSLEDAAEFGKIGRYYAAESMLLLNPETGEYDADATPSYGKDTLEEFFKRVIREGMAGQELGEQSIF